MTSSRPAAEALLLADRRTTVARLAALGADFDQMVEASDASNNDDEHDPEGATIAFERAQVSSLIDRSRAHLADLDRALERIDMDTYGQCASCGRDIADERLLAQPATTICVSCAATPPQGRLRGR